MEGIWKLVLGIPVVVIPGKAAALELERPETVECDQAVGYLFEMPYRVLRKETSLGHVFRCECSQGLMGWVSRSMKTFACRTLRYWVAHY
jgi:hypothetical protein